MVRYGKTTQCAIAAISYLAERHGDEHGLVSSMDIAERRHLPKPLVAKVLTALSQAGLVSGSPGPKGGYRLAKPPDQITLFDVSDQFEQPERAMTCPFGPDYCGHGSPCPLHDQLVAIQDQITAFLHETTLAVFADQQEQADRPPSDSQS